jgi:DNA-binding protein YbaB
MPDDLNEKLEHAAKEVRELIKRAKSLESALSAKDVYGADDGQTVRARVNGHGTIVDLEIQESALKYPGRIGGHISTAIMRARKRADALSEKAKARYLPELPTPYAWAGDSSSRHSPVDFHAIDYDGPAEAKNRIAEAMEAMRHLELAMSGFDERRVRQDLQCGGGYIEINVSMNHLDIVIDPAIPQQMGVRRLSGQVVRGIAMAEQRASEIRAQALDAVQLSTGSLGGLLRAAAQKIGEVE